MKKLRYLLAFALVMFGVGCSDSPEKRSPSINSNSNNPVLCGDGSLDPGESCDPAIPEGNTGACPTSCSAADACSTAMLVGSATTCDLECISEPLACAGGDGCCPSGCDSSTDDDCNNSCGNGEIEAPELCDGDCPSNCDDGEACTLDTLSGSSQRCSAQCTYMTQTACIDGDDCCPNGCDGMDSDCSCVPDDPCANLACGSVANSCGTTVECGSCQDGFSCQDNQCVEESLLGQACTSNSDCGSGGICDTQGDTGITGGYCTTACQSDGDCPAGGDCASNGRCLLACAADTDCTRPGYLCVKGFLDIDDGVCFAGGTGNGEVGDACNEITDCGGRFGAICLESNNYPGGYCSKICDENSDCPSGSHCFEVLKICRKTCSSDSDCRAGYGCGDLDRDGRNECIPSYQGNGEIGDPCQGNSDCGGGIYAGCLNTTNFPNGSCTLFCSPGQGSCGSGAFCSDVFSNSDVCIKSCSSSSECRASYTCEPLSSNLDEGCVSL